MLLEDMPPCLCGNKDEEKFKGGGGQIGGAIATTFWRCLPCQRYIAHLVLYGLEFIITDASANPDQTQMRRTDEFINDTLIPFARAERDRLGDGVFPDVVPPRLPVECSVRIRSGAGWREVTQAESAKVVMPKDPIRTRHEAFWGLVLGELNIKGYKEIKNEYYDDRLNNEPWYEFVIEGAMFHIGPRKRVSAIKVVRAEPFDVVAIRDLAKTDNVSYWATLDDVPDERCLAGGDGWHEWGLDTANTLHVHAWGRDNTIKYLDAIIKSLKKKDANLSAPSGAAPAI